MKMLGLESGSLMVHQKGIFFMCDHDPGEVPRECLCLNLVVPGHLVSVQATNELDDVIVDSQREEGHGTSGIKGVVGDVLGFKYQVWPA